MLLTRLGRYMGSNALTVGKVEEKQYRDIWADLKPRKMTCVVVNLK